jgi:hypothetical protein
MLSILANDENRTMAPRRSPREPTSNFHMKTRSRGAKSASDSSSTDLSSPPTITSSPPTPPNQSTQPNPRKRKASSSGADSQPPAPKLTQPSKRKDEDFLSFKSRLIWPEFKASKPVYYQSDGMTISGPLPKAKRVKRSPPPPSELSSSTETEREPEPVDAEKESTSESRSPKKSTRGGGGGRGRGGYSGNAGGRKPNKQKPKNGGAGGGRDSPDPPLRKGPLTQDDRVEISMLKARQHELKKFFSVVGNQQIDILDKLATKDLSKISRKPKAHKHVPEFDQVTETLEALKNQTRDDFVTKRDLQFEYEKQRLEHEKEVIEQQYRTRLSEAKKEHLAGAQGDIILFERAYRAAHDDTHTESGSDMDYFPHYHELPEPNAQPRGYISDKIMDEKPFMSALETYDDQARQQVLEEDVIHPLLKQIEERNNEWREDEFRKKTMNMDTLSAEAAKELENIKGYLVPKPFPMQESNSYALSALADVAEWTARQYAEHYYIYMPLAQGDTFPRQGLDFSPMPGSRPMPSVRPMSRNIKPASNGQTPLSAPPNSSSTPLPPPPRMISTGPGQAIAPAPPKPVTRSSSASSSSLAPPLLRASRLGSQSGGSRQSNGPQQFIFQTPQQPLQHQAAPGPSPTPQYGPAGSAAGAAPVGQQTKIPMTFINQTIKVSRNAAASAGGNAGGGSPSGSVVAANVKGGQRLLLPKMQQ